MKIRTDFVTNSSSSGYVVITVVDDNGKSVDFEYEYDSGYGGYFWNGYFPYTFKTCSCATKSGSELMKDISYLVSDSVLKTQEGKQFTDAVKEIKAVRAYSIEENTRYDTGGEDSAEYSIRYSTSLQKGDFSYSRYSKDETGKVRIDVHEGNPRLDISDEIDQDPAADEDYYEKDPQIVFKGKTFAFCGVGGNGTINECHPVVIRVLHRGGVLSKEVIDTTDYLIVNPGPYGRSMINRAIELQKKGNGIKIILLKDLRTALEQPIQDNTDINKLIEGMSLFDRIEDLEPTYRNGCLFYGVFRRDKTGYTFLRKTITNNSEWIESLQILRSIFHPNGWEPVSELEYYVRGIEERGSAFSWPFIVIGDITVEQFASGKLQDEYRRIEELKKKYNVGVYAESNFFSIGKNHYTPLPKVRLDSIKGLTVCCKGAFETSFAYLNKCIKAHGGIPKTGFPTKTTDVFVISDETFASCSCNSSRLADAIEKSWKDYQKTGKPLLITESDFSAMGFFKMPGRRKK